MTVSYWVGATVVESKATKKVEELQYRRHEKMKKL